MKEKQIHFKEKFFILFLQEYSKKNHKILVMGREI